MLLLSTERPEADERCTIIYTVHASAWMHQLAVHQDPIAHLQSQEQLFRISEQACRAYVLHAGLCEAAHQHSCDRE